MPMPKTWSIQDAKNRFSEVVTAARKSPQTVTKHGKPAVVVLDAEEYARITRKKTGKKKTFIDHLLAIPKGEPFDRPQMTERDIEF
jgi:prevent-host-death family protein